MKRFAAVIVVFGVVSVAGCVGVRAFEHWMLYHPTAELLNTPADIGLEYDEHFLPVGRDQVHAWWVKTSAETPRGVVLFFHGNGGNMGDRVATMTFWTNHAFDIVIFDYRGYGRSTGKPSEKKTYEDSRAVWDLIAETVPPDQIIVHGRSLGGGVSSWLVTEVTPKAYIIESSFQSVPEIAKDLMPWVPRWLVRTRYDTVGRIGGIACPVLVSHSQTDDVIPYHHGRALFDAASEPKRWLELEGGHNGGWTDTPTYPQEINDFLTGVAGFPP